MSALDTSGNSAQAILSISQKITINPGSGVSGDTVAVSGAGFAPDSTVALSMVSGTGASGPPLNYQAVSTDANGSFSSNFTVPSASNGNWIIQATDTGGNSAIATLTVKQKITIAPTTGVAGDTVAITGTGFAASKAMTILFNGSPVATSPISVNSDINGEFTASATVPAIVAGSYEIDTADGANSASANFIVVVSATISPATSSSSPGYIGMQLTISGTGFKTNSMITITLDSSSVSLSSGATDAYGSFTINLTVPSMAKGSHTIHVSDGATIKDFPFVMEGTPPPAPSLLLPLDKSGAQQPVQFSWSTVSDPSGVTYELH